MENVDSDQLATPAVNTEAVKSGLTFLYSLPLTDLTSDNHDAALQGTIDLVGAHFGSDHAYILLRDNHDDKLKIAARACRDTESDQNSTISEAVTNAAIKTSRAVLVQNAMKSKEFVADPSFQRFNIESAICVPMKSAQSLLGLIYLDSAQKNCAWGTDDLNLLNLAAACLGPEIEVVNLHQRKEQNHRLVTAGQVTLNVSHSIKNILQLITGAAEVLDFGLRTNQMHRVKRSWEILKPNLEKIKQLTVDMLDYNRERPLGQGPCEFNKIIQTAVESLQIQLKEKKTKLHIRIDQKIPTIELDSDKICQMAVNLILNAIDIVDHETGVVSVETIFHPDEAAVELRIHDNGPVLSDEEKEKIFLPFQSVRTKTGSGLGIAIARKIVEQHKGRIEVESEEHKGTTFTIILPATIVTQE